MRLDPALRALRSDPAPQLRAQEPLYAAQAELFDSERWQALRADLRRYADGAELARCPALHRVYATRDGAPQLFRDLSSRYLRVLAEHPFGHVPHRHFSDGYLSTMMLVRCGPAMLMLVARQPAVADPRSVVLSHGERHDVVLAGTGRLRLYRRTSGDPQHIELTSEDRDLAPGSWFSVKQETEAAAILRSDTMLVTLRLSREGDPVLPMREYRLPDGQFTKQAAGVMRESRHELMMRLLGAMECADAVPLLAEMALDGSDALRWQALRECLALDSGAGFSALCRIANDPGDPLYSAAVQLRAQLVQHHPVLATLAEDAACLA